MGDSRARPSSGLGQAVPPCTAVHCTLYSVVRGSGHISRDSLTEFKLAPKFHRSEEKRERELRSIKHDMDRSEEAEKEK